jgi:Tfp pilus assembly protein PilV
MKRQGASLSQQAAGFTVAEFVAAAAILFIILVGVLGAVEYAGASTRMAAMRQSAINVATAQVEKNRNLPWDDIGVTYSNGYAGNPPGTIPANTTVTTSLGTFAVDTEVWWAKDQVTAGVWRAAYKKMRVTVSWADPTPGRLAVETAVFGQGETGNAGDVQIIAVEADDPSKVVPGVSIVIDPSGAGATSLAKTDSDGVAFFSGVPLGGASITGTSPSWLVDTTGLESVTIVSGYQNLGFVKCQKGCTAVVHVRSDGVENLAGATVTLKDKDRPTAPVKTAVTDADGNATFSPLWVSLGAGYEVTATYGSQASPAGTFSLSTSGQVLNPAAILTVADPPSITVSKVVASTTTTITGRSWRVQIKNPSGTQILDTTTTNDSVTKAITVGGTYTIIVTGVSGFLDNAAFAFTASASGAGQVCQVPMTPYFLVRTLGVRSGYADVPIPNGQVTVTKVGGGPVIKTVAGANPPGITDVDGEIGFSILTDGDYNVVGVVNGITYNGAQTTIVAASPPTTPYDLDITLGHLIVRVKSKTSSGWKRYVGLYDSDGDLVATGQATKADPDVDFWVPGGNYTAVICGANANTLPMPSTIPADSPTRYGSHAIPKPVPTNGGTVYAPSSYTTWAEP